MSKLYSKIINIGVFDRIRNQQSRIFLNTIYIVQKQIRTGCSCCKLNISLGYCLCISICPVLSDVRASADCVQSCCWWTVVCFHIVQRSTRSAQICALHLAILSADWQLSWWENENTRLENDWSNRRAGKSRRKPSWCDGFSPCPIVHPAVLFSPSFSSGVFIWLLVRRLPARPTWMDWITYLFDQYV